MAKKYVHISQREWRDRTRAEAREFQQKVIDDLEAEHEHILEHLREDHQAKIDKIKEQHQDQIDSIQVTLVEVKKNETDQPIEIGEEGVIVLPGDYYIVDGQLPTGITAKEFEKHWDEATQEDQ